MTTLPVWKTTVMVGVASGTQDLTAALSGLGAIAAGDTIVVELFALSASAATSWSQFAGPTFASQYANTATATPVAVFTRYCDGTETGSITFRRSTTINNAIMVVSKVSGVDPTTPIPAGGVSATTGTATTYTHGSLTPSQVNSLSLQFQAFTGIAAGVTWTPPSGVTSRFSGQASGQGVAASLGSQDLASAAATGTRAWTHTTSTATRGIHLLLNPVADGGGAPALAKPKVVIGGTRKTVPEVDVIVGGVKKTLTGLSVIIGGVKKPFV